MNLREKVLSVVMEFAKRNDNIKILSVVLNAFQTALKIKKIYLKRMLISLLFVHKNDSVFDSAPLVHSYKVLGELSVSRDAVFPKLNFKFSFISGWEKARGFSWEKVTKFSIHVITFNMRACYSFMQTLVGISTDIILVIFVCEYKRVTQ